MQDLVKRLSTLLREQNIMLTTAESCTGGQIAAAITSLPGASSVFDRGFVTYSNAAKTQMLGVPAQIINTHGAVSAQTAVAMAKGALENSDADIAISITGIAGPEGGSADKPVGTLYIGVAKTGHDPKTHHHNFTGTRTAIQNQAVQTALTLLIESLSP